MKRYLRHEAEVADKQHDENLLQCPSTWHMEPAVTEGCFLAHGYQREEQEGRFLSSAK